MSHSDSLSNFQALVSDLQNLLQQNQALRMQEQLRRELAGLLDPLVTNIAGYAPLFPSREMFFQSNFPNTTSIIAWLRAA